MIAPVVEEEDPPKAVIDLNPLFAFAKARAYTHIGKVKVRKSDNHRPLKICKMK